MHDVSTPATNQLAFQPGDIVLPPWLRDIIADPTSKTHTTRDIGVQTMDFDGGLSPDPPTETQRGLTPIDAATDCATRDNSTPPEDARHLTPPQDQIPIVLSQLSDVDRSQLPDSGQDRLPHSTGKAVTTHKRKRTLTSSKQRRCEA